jgi:lysophospholipase L1-like esterase
MVHLMSGFSDSSRANLLGYLAVGYPLFAVGLLLMAGLAVIGLITVRRRPGRIRSVLARGTLLGTTGLVGLLVAEIAVGSFLSWVHRMPRLAMRDGLAARSGPGDDVNIVVVGESSAEGVPYRDWLSAGKVVVWQLRRLFPQRMFHLEVQARAGWTLEQMHQKLAELRRRPGAVILYAGHNEFASRDPWSGEVPYYNDDLPPDWQVRLANWSVLYSPVCRLIREARDRELVAARPAVSRRRVVDVPAHTAAQDAERLAGFRRRLDAILADLKAAGVLTVVIVPPGNDTGFEPSRSVLPPGTPRAERQAFAAAVGEARALETSDPGQSIANYRALIARQPGFAETHFRLARLLEAAGDWDEAYREYVSARDLDGHPMRCPSAFQDACRELAVRHGAVLVDGQAVLHARHPHGLLNDDLFNDAMHPSFEGHVALGEAVLAGLKERGAFGWPASLPAPTIDLVECARHFDVTVAAWKEVCRFAVGFYRTTAAIRFDPAERGAKADRYEAELRRLEAGGDVDSGACPGVGVRPIRSRSAPERAAALRRLGRVLEAVSRAGEMPKHGQSKWATAWPGSVAIRTSSCLR